MSEDKLFDGIAQADNKLPAWYIISFIGTVVYAVIYLIVFHIAADWSQTGQYKDEVTAHNAVYKTAAASSSGPSVTDKNPYRGDAKHIAEGEKTYKNVCAACHGQKAEGVVGPSLADDKWLHGSSEAAVFKTIWEGVDISRVKQNPPMGPMPAKGSQDLSEEQVWSVIAYLTDKYKNIEAGSGK